MTQKLTECVRCGTTENLKGWTSRDAICESCDEKEPRIQKMRTPEDYDEKMFYNTPPEPQQNKIVNNTEPKKSNNPWAIIDPNGQVVTDSVSGKHSMAWRNFYNIMNGYETVNLNVDDLDYYVDLGYYAAKVCVTIEKETQEI